MLQEIINRIPDLTFSNLVYAFFMAFVMFRMFQMVYRDALFSSKSQERQLYEMERIVKDHERLMAAQQAIDAAKKTAEAVQKVPEFDPSKGRKTVKLGEPNTARM